MTCGLASKTCSPAHGGTSAVYRPCSSIGTIVGMPAALADQLVLLAEAGGEVDDAGAVLGGDEVGGEHLEGAARCRSASASVKKSNSGR